MNFYKFFTDIKFLALIFFSLHFCSLAHSCTRYFFTYCVILVHLTRFDISTIVLKSSHLIILIMTSYLIQSSLITLFYTAIVFHVRCCAFVLQAPRSAYFYPLSYILYIAGFIVYGRVKLFSFKIYYDYSVVPHGGSLATRQMVYLLLYCYICIFNNILLYFSYRFYYG